MRYTQFRWSPIVEVLPGAEHRRLRSQANQRFGGALTNGLFMSSRDGRTFKRWGEAFIRSGPQLEDNWVYGHNHQCCGLIEKPSVLEGEPPEFSLFAREGVWRVATPCQSVATHYARTGLSLSTRPVCRG